MFYMACYNLDTFRSFVFDSSTREVLYAGIRINSKNSNKIIKVFAVEPVKLLCILVMLSCVNIFHSLVFIIKYYLQILNKT